MTDINETSLELGHGLDQDSADIVAEADECAEEAASGPGDGDALIMAWARAM